MILLSTVDALRQARRSLGNPATLNEAITATGIDALFLLLDGGDVEIQGRRYRLQDVTELETTS